MGGKRRKKIDVGEIKNRRGERSYFTRFFCLFSPLQSLAFQAITTTTNTNTKRIELIHVNTQPPPPPSSSSSSSSLFFFFLLLLFYGIIQSQAANCKLPKRSEIYNSRFKNKSIVFIFIIVVIIEFGSCCKFGFFFPALHHFTLHLISISVSSHWVISWFVQCVHVTCQI